MGFTLMIKPRQVRRVLTRGLAALVVGLWASGPVPAIGATAGGSLSVTTGSTTAVKAGDTFDVTVKLTAAEAKRAGAAGVVLQWKAADFALDAATTGTAGDNDPHGTAYLNGTSGAKANDPDGLVTPVWGTANAAAADDVVELRLSSNDAAADALYGVSGQAYLNYTRTSTFSSAADFSTVISGYTLFTVRIKAKSGLTQGTSTISAKLVAISDDAGSSPGSYTAGTVTLTTNGPAISINTGVDGQNAKPGVAYANALAVTLASSGVPSAGVTVTFSAPAGFTFANGTATTTATTDANGVATASALTAGPTAGAYSVTVSATGYTSKTVALTVGAGNASTLSKINDNQKGSVGAVLAKPFTLTVTDAGGNAVSGATVTFAVASGGGSINVATATTNASGQAGTTLTLGTKAGANTVTATVGSLTAATFTATGTAASATQLLLSASTSSVKATAAANVTITGTIADQYGNTVTGATDTVTFSVGAQTYGDFSGSATASGAASSGVATATLVTKVSDGGTITVSGTTPSLTATAITVTTAAFKLTASRTDLLPGETATLTLVDAATSPDPTWSGSNLSGTSATGATFTAPATITGSTQSFTVTAADTVDGVAKSGSVTFTVYAQLSVKDSQGNLLTAAPVVRSDASLSLTLGGGKSSEYTASVVKKPTGAADPTVQISSTGEVTITPPSTGAFAGEYMVKLISDIDGTDVTSRDPLTKTVTFSVPLKIAVNSFKTVAGGTNQVSVSGGGNGDVFGFVILNNAGVLDTSGSVAAVGTTTPATTDNKSSPTYVATAVIDAAGVAAVSNYSVRATNTSKASTADAAGNIANSAYTVARTGMLTVIPGATYTVTVKGSDGLALQNATLVLQGMDKLQSEFGGTFTLRNSGKTDSEGKVTVTLPAGVKYIFDVRPADTSYQTATVAVDNTLTSVVATLRKIGSPVTYKGIVDLDDTAYTAAGVAKPVATVIEAFDASGAKVFGTFACSNAAFTTAKDCDNNGANWQFTVVVDSAVFTPKRFVASAATAKMFSRETTDLVLSCSNAALTTQSTCVAGGGTWQADYGAALKFVLKPVIAQTVAATDLKNIRPDNVGTFDWTAIGGAGTVRTELDAGAGNKPVLNLLKNAGGDVIGVVPVFDNLGTTQAAKVTGGSEGIATAGSKPVVVGESGSTTFSLASNSSISTMSSVGIKVDANSLKSNVDVYFTVRAAKLADTSIPGYSTKTGGEVVEIDMTALDSTGAAVSTGEGNTLIDSSVGVPVEIPVAVNTSTLNLATLAVYTAPTLQDFLDGSAKALTGAKIEIASPTSLLVYMPHFSAVTVGDSGSSAASAGGGGGGGCFIATAAYGSYEEPSVVLLRDFRDRYLLTNALGQRFVDWYYESSPPAADWLRQHDGWRGVVRVLLLPLIGMSWLMVAASPVVQFAVLLGVPLLVGGLLVVRRRRTRALGCVA
ncbi:MAG: Ig-like domain-containing protein [Magnetococcales bacterium]|nr:Ig-like domain-containing protein [Magnetococcales bacterium]